MGATPTWVSPCPARRSWIASASPMACNNCAKPCRCCRLSPYLLLNPDAWHNHNEQLRPLPELAQVLDDISRAADGVDLVGFYAAGPISRGFASSSGAFGWHRASDNFNFDFQPVPTPMAKR